MNIIVSHESVNVKNLVFRFISVYITLSCRGEVLVNVYVYVNMNIKIINVFIYLYINVYKWPKRVGKTLFIINNPRISKFFTYHEI